MDGPRRAPAGAGRKRKPPVPPTARDYPEVVTGTKNSVRRVFHILLILCGWVTFALFWYYIFVRGTGEEASQTFVILMITMIGVIVVNWLWVVFNLSLYKLRGSRTAVRNAPFTATRDVLGRILITPGWPAVQQARIIDIVLDRKRSTKRYVTDPERGRKATP